MRVIITVVLLALSCCGPATLECTGLCDNPCKDYCSMCEPDLEFEACIGQCLDAFPPNVEECTL